MPRMQVPLESKTFQTPGFRRLRAAAEQIPHILRLTKAHRSKFGMACWGDDLLSWLELLVLMLSKT